MCEIPSVYINDRPVARKEHKCYECRGIIRVGEKYHKHHGIWDGEAATYKVCDDCENVREEIDSTSHFSEDLTAFGQLSEAIFEGREKTLISRYLTIKRNRGAKIPTWMTERENEVK